MFFQLSLRTTHRMSRSASKCRPTTIPQRLCKNQTHFSSLSTPCLPVGQCNHQTVMSMLEGRLVPKAISVVTPILHHCTGCIIGENLKCGPCVHRRTCVLYKRSTVCHNLAWTCKISAGHYATLVKC